MNTQNTMNHIAFIMDGNRRWATQRGLPKMGGHTEGGKNLKRITRAVKRKSISHMTVYALSTENLKRSASELKHLFSLFKRLVEYLDDFQKEGTRFRVIGDMSRLPKDVLETLDTVAAQTKHNTEFTLTIAVAYGGRDEIVRAVNKAIQAQAPVTEESFGRYLDTGDQPPVDLIVRTGGHHRLSNFLLWSGAYAELYVTDTYWPAFEA